MRSLTIENLVYQHYKPLHVVFKGGATDVITSIDYDSKIIGFLNRNANSLLSNDDFKLMLRPMSELRDSEVWDRLSSGFEFEFYGNMLYKNVKLLLENQFDVFDLIDKGLAVKISNY